jgi:hypothetical protein
MNSHLTEDQIAEYIVGRSIRADQQHIAGCLQCRSEVERISASIAAFRSAVRDRVDARVASSPARLLPIPAASATPAVSKWQWALAGAMMVIIAVVPFITRDRLMPQEDIIEATPAETNPDELMDAVYRHLSRTVPAPMERVMVLIPDEEPDTKSGGVQ